MTEALFLFAMTEFALSLIPGPAVLLVVSLSMNKGYGAGLSATAGILSINIIFFGLSALGIGAALAASETVFAALKYIGAAYLIWTAWEIIRDTFFANTGSVERQTDTAMLEPRQKSGRVGAYMRGLFVQGSSIKNLLIFIAIVPQFIDVNQAPLHQFLALGLVSVAVELPILVGYAFVTTRLTRMCSGTVGLYMNGLSAGLLVAIAGGMAFV